jgi:hypothetical protein
MVPSWRSLRNYASIFKSCSLTANCSLNTTNCSLNTADCSLTTANCFLNGSQLEELEKLREYEEGKVRVTADEARARRQEYSKSPLKDSLCATPYGASCFKEHSGNIQGTFRELSVSEARAR